MPQQEVRADLLLGRDTLSPGLVKAGRVAAQASGNVKDLGDQLRRLSDRTYDARLGLKGDKEAGATLDKLTAKLIRLSQRKVDPEVDLAGYLRTRAEITSLELELDKLSRKTATPSVAVRGLGALAGAGIFQPSALGAGLALLPTLIPLTAQVAAGAVAVGVSFGAATIGAAGFGLMAKTVLSSAAEEMKKLQALNLRLNSATTAAQRKTIRQQIADLKSTWAPGFQALIGNYQDFQDRWKKISQQITVPTLNVWLPVLTKALTFLKPLIKPIADAFTLWGISLNTYFKDPAAAKHIKDMAAAFGNFAAQQLFRIGQFIKDIGEGVFNLGKDLASNGANFNSFGLWLSNIGDAFLKWSRSDAARKDVQGFMKFLHDEGPVVKGILSDLGDILPGIFAGATTIGTLELQALGDFLNLVASLPPGWQKPLTEFAGAMLLLSKIGVVKVGLKLTGLGLGSLAAVGGSGPLAAGGAAIAAGLVLRVREDLKSGLKGILNDLPTWLSGIGGVFTLAAQGWADAIANHFHKPVLAAQHAFGRAFIASVKADWSAVTASFRAFTGALTASFRAFTGALLSSAAAFGRAFIASAKTTWNTVFASARSFINLIVGLFRGMTSRVLGALFGLGHSLYAFAHAAFTQFLSGFRAVGGSILRWLGGFVSSVVRLVKRILHIGSPSGVFHDIGVNMMLGLERGIKASAHKAANASRDAARATTGAFADTGARSGSARLAQSFARSVLPRGWSFPALLSLWNQESSWNAYAVNPSSGAYGIPQSLGHGHPYNLGDYKAQVLWGINYIAGRYGSSQNAWAHERAFSWYGSGLAGGIFSKPTLIGVGESGPERVDIAPVRSPRSAGKVVLQIQPTGTSAFDRFMADWLSDAARVRGGGSLEVAFGNHH